MQPDQRSRKCLLHLPAALTSAAASAIVTCAGVALAAMSELLRCPFASSSSAAAMPPGHPPLPPLRTYTLESLLQTSHPVASPSSSAAAAPASHPLRVAVKGSVLDVSGDPRFQPGGVWHAAVGRDLTRTLAFTPVGAAAAQAQTDVASPQGGVLRLEPEHQGPRALEGLDFDALRRLETWAQHLQERYTTVGRLLTAHEAAALSTSDPSVARPSVPLALPGESDMAPLPSDIYGSFLPLVEQARPVAGEGSASAAPSRSLHALLDADEREECSHAISRLPLRSPLLDAACHRSTMTPLHKAVEKDWPDVVRALVARGADLSLPCALYDGDTALQLARRFQALECQQALEHTTPPPATAVSSEMLVMPAQTAAPSHPRSKSTWSNRIGASVLVATAALALGGAVLLALGRARRAQVRIRNASSH